MRRSIQAVRSKDAWILDITAPTEIEAVQRLTEREGGQEPWEGRLDLSDAEHCAVLNRMVWAQRIDEQGSVQLVRFNAQKIKDKLDREAGRVICSVGGEFDHVARTLKGLPRRFFDLLVEYQGRDVTHEMIVDRVLDGKDPSQSTIYGVRRRLREAPLPAIPEGLRQNRDRPGRLPAELGEKLQRIT